MKGLFQKHLIVKTGMLLFILLFIIFVFYLFINTSYNTQYFTHEREGRIEQYIEHVVAETDHYTAAMEQKAADLAQLGEMFYRVRASTSTILGDEVFRYLTESFENFPNAIGGGLWYEPGVFFADQRYFGPYVYRDNGLMVPTLDLSTPEYDYHTQDWYTLALPAGWDRNMRRERTYYWTTPYRDEAGSFSEMITVDAFMHDELGRIIGISTADWSLSGIQSFLGANTLFEHGAVVLIDRGAKVILAHTSEPDMVMQSASSISWLDSLVEPRQHLTKQVDVNFNDHEYRVYYRLTDVGMLYTIIVPLEEIVAPVTELQTVNAGMLIVLGLVLFTLTTMVLIYVLRPIVEITGLAESISNGDLDTRIRVTSNDELGVLAAAFNTMAGKIKNFQSNLRKKVDEKTLELSTLLKEIEGKNQDLQRSQLATINLLEDLEEEKKSIENKIIERTNELQVEKHKLLQVTSHMRGAAVLFNSSRSVIFTNNELYALLNCETTLQEDKVLEHIYSYFEGTEIRAYVDRCFKGESFHVKQISGGERIYEIYFHYFAHTGDEKEVPTYFMLIFDITDFKLLEHSKSELVSVASHQLRTPLTAMRGNVEMLVDESFGTLNSGQHELLNDIQDSTLRLITMVNDMLDITKIERNDFEMNRSPMNLHHALSSVIGDLNTYANQHEVSITIDTVARDIVIEGDEVRLRQVFQNLIDNAIKYGKYKGVLEISAKVNNGTAEIQFKDDGIGIPKNEHDKIFNRFYRATNTSKATSSGSGLGLYIVRAIARQHGGDISFTSEEGVGTVFTVTLPIKGV